MKLRHRNLELDDLYDEYGIDLDDEEEEDEDDFEDPVPAKKKSSKKGEKKGKKQKLEEIKSAVAKVGVEKKVSITDVIEDISKNKNIDEEIRKEVVERVENKITTLTTDDYAVKPYTIKKILLKNFQSHKDSVIECHEGLNVFVGESRNGKTAIQRALDFVFEGTKKNPRNYIKKGETEIAIGNVLGSNVFNILFVLGLAATIMPLSVSPVALVDLMVIAIVTIVTFVCMKKDYSLNKKHGIMFIIMYAAYMAYTIMR